MIKSSLKKMMARPLTRREFLNYVGAVALVVVGVTGLFKTLTETQLGAPKPGSRSAKGKVNIGYGSSVYGGKS